MVVVVELEVEMFESDAQTAVVPRCGVRDCPVVEGESRTIRRSRETEPESTLRLSPAERLQSADTAIISRPTTLSSSRLLPVVGAVQVSELSAGVGSDIGARAGAGAGAIAGAWPAPITSQS